MFANMRVNMPQKCIMRLAAVETSNAIENSIFYHLGAAHAPICLQLNSFSKMVNTIAIRLSILA